MVQQVRRQVGNPNFWCLKKLANVVSGLPVLYYVAKYNKLITHQTGRGNISGQTLIVVEYFHMGSQMLSFCWYAFQNDESINQWQNNLQAFRVVSFMSDWTRILAHAMFLNSMEEAVFMAEASGNCADDTKVVSQEIVSASPRRQASRV